MQVKGGMLAIGGSWRRGAFTLCKLMMWEYLVLHLI